jgi:peptide/nickel transport system permease protein
MTDTNLSAAADDAGRAPSWKPRLKTAWRISSSVVVTLFGLLALTFFIGRLLPIDPVISIIGDQADQATYDMVYKKLGLDKPLYVQFYRYITAVMRFDFGTAIFSGKLVVEDIKRVFPATVELSTFGLLFGALVGVPMGVLAAVRRNTLIDHCVRVFGLIGYSAPIFWLGLMGLIVFYGWLDWVGGPGRVDTYYIGIVDFVTGSILIDAALADEWDIFWNAISHMIMPGLLLGFIAMAYIARMTRSFMLDQLNQEYIITARVKGMSNARVIWFHAFRNITVPLITVLALSYGLLLEGAVLTETVFAWPGFGQYLTNALLVGDMNAVLACTLLIGSIFITLNLLSDLLYQILDPRTK